MEGDSSKDLVGVGGVDEGTGSSIGVGVGESVGVSGAGGRPLDVNVDETPVPPKDPSHLLVCDVQLQVAGKQGPGG